MKRTMLAAAALAAIAFAATPVSATKMRGTACSGDNLAKAETMVTALPDGDANKMKGNKEMTDANEAFSSGKMSECAMHLNAVMHMGASKSM